MLDNVRKRRIKTGNMRNDRKIAHLMQLPGGSPGDSVEGGRGFFVPYFLTNVSTVPGVFENRGSYSFDKNV